MSEAEEPEKRGAKPKVDWTQYLKEGETLEGPNAVSEGTLRKRKHDQGERRAKELATRVFDSTVEPTKNQARTILENERNIKHPHVLEVVLSAAEFASQNLRIPFNGYLFTHGVRAALKSRELDTQQDAPEISDKPVPGELISRKELFAIYDYSAYRESLTFEEFLALRHECKTNPFILGRDVLGKDFHEKPHGGWRDFFPRFDPDALPKNYTQEQMKAWLGSQSSVKEFVLLASRNAYKSSWSIVWLVSAILCLPDLRALLVSETKPLSKGFVRSLRSYFEVSNKREPTRFQQLFPEYAIPVGDGSTLTFESPMAHLNLIQSTAESTSMDSTVAGNRADIILFDDPISNVTVGNTEQRQASIDKHDLILKLREVGGYTTVLGTPWHPEDLYATLIDRAENNPHMLVKLDPAWTVKEHAKNKDLLELVEDDVDLLFPTRLTWKFLQEELRRDLRKTRFFRSQNLIEFVPDDESLIKLVFDRSLLMSSVINHLQLPMGDRIIVADTAFSNGPRADHSVLGVFQVSHFAGKKVLFVVDMVSGRMRSSEVSAALVRLARQHEVRRAIVEKTPVWDLVLQNINLAAQTAGISLHVYGAPVSNKKSAKLMRLKNAEASLVRGELKFVSGAYITDLFDALERLNEKPSSAKKKDDEGDVLGLALHHLLPSSEGLTAEELKDREYEREVQQREANMRANYERVFSTGTEQRPQMPTVIPQVAGHPALGSRFADIQRERSAAIRNRGR